MVVGGECSSRKQTTFARRADWGERLGLYSAKSIDMETDEFLDFLLTELKDRCNDGSMVGFIGNFMCQ